jgi:hypothetical protein
MDNNSDLYTEQALVKIVMQEFKFAKYFAMFLLFGIITYISTLFFIAWNYQVVQFILVIPIVIFYLFFVFVISQINIMGRFIKEYNLKIVEVDASDLPDGQIKVVFNGQIKISDAADYICELYKLSSGDLAAKLVSKRRCIGWEQRFIFSNNKGISEIFSDSKVNQIFWINPTASKKDIFVKALRSAISV